MLTVTLLTGGTPQQLTGGHLFHRRMIDAAPAHGARVDTALVRGVGNPLRGTLGAPGSVRLVDSLVAARVAPWAASAARAGPIAAIVHQQPGGVDRGAVRAAVQRRLDLALYRRCVLLLAVSQSIAEQLADELSGGVSQHGPLRADRIVVVQPGRDLPTTAAPTELRHRRRAAVLCVANWLPNKGIVELLDAIATVPADHVTVHLVGATDVDPGYAVRVHERLSAPELRDRVVVHGPVQPRALAALYRGADVFALPSRTEAFGTVYAEALTAGLPVVGWRSGNLPNLVTDGVEGCLLDPGDTQGLGRALARLASDDRFRIELASAARRRGADLPTWDDTANRFFGALSRVARAPG